MKIPIKGIIVANDEKWIYELFGYEVTTPRDVDQLLNEVDDEDLEVLINSPGGDVYSGSEIYTILKDHANNVDVKIVGVAASAASVVAMAGDSVKISPTAQIMIHNVSSGAQGDYREMEHQAEVLKNYNKSIANAYRLKTNLSEEELLDLMNSEKWLNAQEAKSKGFVDQIMFDEGNKLAASFNANDEVMLPPKVVNKLRDLLKDKDLEEETKEKTDNKDKSIYKAKLNLLKLKRSGVEC
jgi:ATP-dependent Clp endopeptidase proteolytic subunit ClpP